MPDGYDNSMVAKDGRAVDTGWNFDEKDMDFDPEAARKAREEAKRG